MKQHPRVHAKVFLHWF